ncbi:NAD-glutamate dehydrogenase, partial [Saccharothrix sp. MB29]|nr:NAD-glutamate dehydrogenase [Saccharothrix sp. MB29]
WHALARLALRDDFYSSLRSITIDVLRSGDPGDGPVQKIAEWEQANASRLSRARAALEEINRVSKLVSGSCCGPASRPPTASPGRAC